MAALCLALPCFATVFVVVHWFADWLPVTLIQGGEAVVAVVVMMMATVPTASARVTTLYIGTVVPISELVCRYRNRCIDIGIGILISQSLSVLLPSRAFL